MIARLMMMAASTYIAPRWSWRIAASRVLTLVDEMKMAEIYAPDAATAISGNLDAIDFSSAGGHWDMRLTLKSSNGRSMSLTESYPYTTSFYGETACNQTAQALMPAVQDLVGKAVRSPEFKTLVAQ